jgi:hypothetical protein
VCEGAWPFVGLKRNGKKKVEHRFNNIVIGRGHNEEVRDGQ